MDRIILEVDDQTSKAWQRTSAKLRQEIEKNLVLVLIELLNKAQEANFETILNEARAEAAKRGLTPEILESLLASDD